MDNQGNDECTIYEVKSSFANGLKHGKTVKKVSKQGSQSANGSEDKSTTTNGSEPDTSVANGSTEKCGVANESKRDGLVANVVKTEPSIVDESQHGAAVASGREDAAWSPQSCVPNPYPGRTWNELSCEVCHRTFTSKRSLAMHGEYTGQGMPFRCKNCCLVFSSASNLEEHAREHSVEESRLKKIVEDATAREERETVVQRSIILIL